MTQVTLLYFASLRERAGVASEAITTDAPDLAGVYDDVQARHGPASPVTMWHTRLPESDGQL